jgi:hypothetical protein
MSATNNNSIFFPSLDDVSLSPLKLSNLNSQGQEKPRSFPVLLQPKLQRLTPFSLLESTQNRPRTFLIKELDFSFVSNTALKPYSERTSIVIDQAWARTSAKLTPYTDRNFTNKGVWKTHTAKSPQEKNQQHLEDSTQVQQHSPTIVNKDTYTRRSSPMVECNNIIPVHQNLDTTQEHTPAHQRSPFIVNKEWSYNSNTLQEPTPMVECRYSEHGFNRLSHTPQGSSARSSFNADQSWPQMSPVEGYAQLPPMMISDQELDPTQRRPIIIPEHMHPMRPYSQTETSAKTTTLTFNQRLKQEQSNKENESESKEFACSECDKIYKGKNARSILRRHLKDKHKIEQPRGTRWDNDPNRPKTDEERRQRMLESKRR